MLFKNNYSMIKANSSMEVNLVHKKEKFDWLCTIFKSRIKEIGKIVHDFKLDQNFPQIFKGLSGAFVLWKSLHKLFRQN